MRDEKCGTCRSYNPVSNIHGRCGQFRSRMVYANEKVEHCPGWHENPLLTKLHAKCNILQIALQKVEWLQGIREDGLGNRETYQYCPICGPRIRQNGHKPDCVIGKALSSDAGRAMLERIKRLEAVAEASTELLEVAQLRGDNELPHPADDPKTWTGRMQDAWGEIANDLAALEVKQDATE